MIAVTKIYIRCRYLVPVLLLLVLLAGTLPAAATSLWTDQGGMFSDRKAHAIGDTLTIVINETSSASRTGKSSNSKDASGSAAAGTGIFGFIASASTSGKDSFKSQGTISNTNNVSAKMTVQVTAVKPNGNLLVSGTQMIKQNGEEQKILVTGEVRPEDITADNTVLSSYVANAEIRIDGKGPIASKQRQGILTQLFNFLF